MKLTLQNLCAGYNGRKVISGVNASFQTGEITCLLGPNGSGKTTLFKAILGLLPSSGELCLDSRPLHTMSRREKAGTIAYVPQMHNPPFPFTVFDVVLTGRTPHIGNFSSPSQKDRLEAEKALSLLRIEHLSNRNYAQLSGGERQLTLIARALAQSPKFLIMDEPTSHLDFGNQLRTIGLIRRLAGEKIGIILTTHAPDHAFMCADSVLAISGGGVIACGKPQTVLTGPVLQTMYSVNIDIVALSEGRCICAPVYGG